MLYPKRLDAFAPFLLRDAVVVLAVPFGDRLIQNRRSSLTNAEHHLPRALSQEIVETRPPRIYVEVHRANQLHFLRPEYRRCQLTGDFSVRQTVTEGRSCWQSRRLCFV